MSCPPCNQHCRQGRNCPINKQPQHKRRQASAFVDAIGDVMIVLLGVALVSILGFGSGVVFWIVTK
jgi:hypothetical protein